MHDILDFPPPCSFVEGAAPHACARKNFCRQWLYMHSLRRECTVRQMSDAEGILIAMCLSRLGCLPLPMQDLLLPGESKKMHLFEARFLSLFEQVGSASGGEDRERDPSTCLHPKFVISNLHRYFLPVLQPEPVSTRVLTIFNILTGDGTARWEARAGMCNSSSSSD